MKKKSLNFKLVVGGIVVVLLPLLVVGLFSINKASKALETSAKHEALTVSGCGSLDIVKRVLLQVG